MKYQIYIFQKEKEEKFYRKAIDEYKKRLGRYCSISVKYLRKERDWEKLRQSVGERDLAFLLLPGRNDLDSEGLAARIREFENSGIKTLHFFVPALPVENGEACASYGERTAEILSLSDFSLPPSMTGMILFEQIYRSYRILNNQPYHK